MLLRKRVEERTGRRVDLEMMPAGYHLMVAGLNVVVLEVGDERDVRLRGPSWLTWGTVGRTRRVRAAFRSLGGIETRRWGCSSFRFSGEPPTAKDVARALGGVLSYRFGAAAILRSSLFGTPVEVHLGHDTITVEGPLVMTGSLHAAVVAAAAELAERVR